MGQHPRRLAEGGKVTTGSESGNAYCIHYSVDLTKSRSDHTLAFDGWSWMVAPSAMMNRAWGTKFGIEIGDIEAVFIHD